jgi:hypothetical protein
MVCTKCNNERNLEDFPFRNKQNNLRHKTCKICQNELKKIHYLNNKPDYIKRAKIKNEEIVRIMQEIIRNAKKVPCKDCGNMFHECMMDFDHINDDKICNVADIRKYHSIKKLNDEIAKCEVVCSNCHRYRTYLRRNMGRLTG